MVMKKGLDLREDVEASNAKNEMEGGYRILVILVIAW